MKYRGLYFRILVLFLAIAPCTAAWGDEGRPLYKLEPFDQITLDVDNNNAVLKVLPLDLSDRHVPAQPPPESTLRIRLVDRPDEEFKVAWKHIVKVELFELRLLAHAKQLTREEKFNEAFDYYDYLLTHYPNLPGLNNAIEQYLTNNAFTSYQDGQYDDALSLLEEVYRRNPERSNLTKQIQAVANKQIEFYFKRQAYGAVWILLERVAERYGEAQQEWVDGWNERLSHLAADELKRGQVDLLEGRYRQALRAGRHAKFIWPSIEGAEQLISDVLQDYSIVVVGVTQPATDHAPSRLDNWSSRRSSRLLNRTLVECHGHGSESGLYQCPWGTLTVSDDAQNLTIQLRRPKPDAAALLTGYEVASQLLRPNGHGPNGSTVNLIRRVRGVTVSDVFQVSIDFDRPHVHPEAFLQSVTLTRDGKLNGQPGATGPYVVKDSSPEEVVYVTIEDYPMKGATQPREVVEHFFADPVKAISALRRGDIDILDRVPPRYVPQLRQVSSLVVERYDVPTVHMLVPNYEHALCKNVRFRRALMYAIDRQLILDRTLLGQQEVAGCRVLSGPFPVGFGSDDSPGYAYNTSIEPHPNDAELALVLARAFGGLGKADDAHADDPQIPALVLAFPDMEIPRRACQAIVEQLRAIHVPCELKPLPPGHTRPTGDYDLLYVELIMNEPAIDALQLLPHGQLIGVSSYYFPLALRRLDQATNWTQIRRRLHQVHRVVHEELVILPLWQMAEYYAHRHNVRGIGTQPVTLYQDVEQWQVVPKG